MKRSLLLSTSLAVVLAVTAQPVQARKSVKNELANEIDALTVTMKKKKAKKDLIAQQPLTLDGPEFARSERGGSDSFADSDSNSNSKSDAQATSNNSNINVNDNKNTSTNVSVQVTEQQATTVEASPLKESRLDQIKKNRLEIERDTEERLVEKLEKDRMEWEQKRRSKTDSLSFAGDDNKVQQKNIDASKQIEINQVQKEEATTVAPVTTITPVQAKDSTVVIGNKPVEVEAEAETSSTKAKSKYDADSSIEEDFSKVVKEDEEDNRSKFYVGAVGGIGDFNASNVKGVYAAGVLLGIELPHRLAVEGELLFSSYDLTTTHLQTLYPYRIQMEQRNYSIGLKYAITKTTIRPVVGALVSYNTRDFEDVYYTRPSSQGFDVGLLAGGDVMVAENFSLGAAFKYYMNLSSRRDDNGYNYYVPYYQGMSGPYPSPNGKPIDEMNYYVFSVNGTIRF